jgi:hypothetical protein
MTPALIASILSEDIHRNNGLEEAVTLTRPQACKCGRILNAHAGNAIPEAGDISVCYYCGRIMIYNEDLSLREPTEVELSELQDNERLLSLKNCLV